MKVRALIAAVALVVAAPSSALAVWGGEFDGDGHPNVGGMYYDFEPDGVLMAFELVCSGSFAGTHDGYDVFLTAGHCLPPPEFGIPAEALHVSFDPDLSDGVASPIEAEEYHIMPGFGRNSGDPKDLGVLLLAAGAVEDAFGETSPVELPPEGYLDDLKRSGELTFRTVEIVGYGVTPVWGPGGPTTFELSAYRNVGTSVITGLRRADVVHNQNPHGVGSGSGVCFGDSGSPQLAEGTDMVVSVTSRGGPQCNSVAFNYRVDTPAARAFLGQFIALP